MARELILDPRVRLLGLIPLACWMFHYIRYAFVLGEPANMLWMCHVTALLLAIGLIASWASLVRVAAVWAIVGLPLWIVEIVARGTTSNVSVLSHVAVPIVAGLALSQVRGGRGVVVVGQAMALFLVVQQVCRWLTLPAFNINMAHKPYDALFADVVTSYPVYWVITTAGTLALVSLGALAARKAFPVDAEFVEAVGKPELLVVAPPDPVVPEVAAEPGFRLAPKISPTEHRAMMAASRPAPPPAQTAPPVEPSREPRPRAGLTVQRAKDVVPRGFTLLEMTLVVAIIGVMATIALPDLTPAIHTARMRAAADEAVTFLERARRSAQAEGRCFRVTLPSPNRMSMERRTHANCFGAAAAIDDAAWVEVANVTLAPGYSFAGETLPGDEPIVFRPSGRLRGDGDLDTEDDGVRILITSPSTPTKSTVVFVTAQGRICAFLITGTLGAFTQPSSCGAPPAGFTPTTPPPSGYA